MVLEKGKEVALFVDESRRVLNSRYEIVRNIYLSSCALIVYLTVFVLWQPDKGLLEFKMYGFEM